MNNEEQERVRLAVSCRDADYIPKIAKAGSVITNSAGERVQFMHNGILVLADRYYSEMNTRTIEGLKGHHEPQEEKIFYEILKSIQPPNGARTTPPAIFGKWIGIITPA